jgi:hypothetical protein
MSNLSYSLITQVSQVRIAAPKSSVQGLQAAFLAVGDKFELDALYYDELGTCFLIIHHV